MVVGRRTMVAGHAATCKELKAELLFGRLLPRFPCLQDLGRLSQRPLCLCDVLMFCY